MSFLKMYQDNDMTKTNFDCAEQGKDFLITAIQGIKPSDLFTSCRKITSCELKDLTNNITTTTDTEYQAPVFLKNRFSYKGLKDFFESSIQEKKSTDFMAFSKAQTREENLHKIKVLKSRVLNDDIEANAKYKFYPFLLKTTKDYLIELVCFMENKLSSKILGEVNFVKENVFCFSFLKSEEVYFKIFFEKNGGDKKIIILIKNKSNVYVNKFENEEEYVIKFDEFKDMISEILKNSS